MSSQQKRIKCAWCGLVVDLTKNGKRPKQHKNGASTCVGSAQEVWRHNGIREAGYAS